MIHQNKHRYFTIIPNNYLISLFFVVRNSMHKQQRIKLNSIQQAPLQELPVTQPDNPPPKASQFSPYRLHHGPPLLPIFVVRTRLW